MNQQATIIDYGMGNLLSVYRALEHIGSSITVSSDPAVIKKAKRLVLPGVGAFGDGMAELKKRGLIDVILERSLNGTPLLGICLGAQMLLDASEEFGQHNGLGLIPGEVRAIPTTNTDNQPLRVPNVGWADLHTTNNHPLLDALPTKSAMYFVHSYQCQLRDSRNLISHCDFGGHAITAMFGHEHITGCQFHPEKSGAAGLHILRNFVELQA
jgi:glutamine amidotransferase